MQTDRIAEIEARLQQAIKGPWEIREIAHEATPYAPRRVYRVEIISPQYYMGRRTHSRDVAQIVDYIEWTDRKATAALIANAPGDLRYLIDRIRELEAQLTAARELVARRSGASSWEEWSTGLDLTEKTPVDVINELRSQLAAARMDTAIAAAAKELWEVASLRGDNSLPHPCDDPKLWTSRMQTAWDELGGAIDAAMGGDRG